MSIREDLHVGSVPCAVAVRASVVTAALDQLQPPLGAWSDPGRFPPVTRWKRLVARAGVAASLGVFRPVPSSRSVLGWSRPGTGFFDVQSSRSAGRWHHLDGPRQRVHPGRRGSPPNRVGAHAPSRSRMSSQCPHGHRECASRRAVRVRGILRLAPPDPPGRAGVAPWQPESRASRRSASLSRCRRHAGEVGSRFPHPLALFQCQPRASLVGLAPFEARGSRW